MSELLFICLARADIPSVQDINFACFFLILVSLSLAFLIKVDCMNWCILQCFPCKGLPSVQLWLFYCIRVKLRIGVFGQIKTNKNNNSSQLLSFIFRFNSFFFNWSTIWLMFACICTSMCSRNHHSKSWMTFSKYFYYLEI